jgi:hypothetical protein
VFIDSLANFFERIDSGFELDEFYVSNFIDEFVHTLSQSDAFEMSSYIVKIINDDLKSNNTYELLSILIALQRQSNTRQLPINLRKKPNIFDEIIKNNSEGYITYLINEIIENYGYENLRL